MTATRRLAAILAADVVGYSRLVGADEEEEEEEEEGTLVRLRTLFREAVQPTVSAHHGRVFPGSGRSRSANGVNTTDKARRERWLDGL